MDRLCDMSRLCNMARLCAHILLLALASGQALVGASRNEGWRKGRATYYGIDGWSIHKGACGLGYQYKDMGTGWDVAAVADASPEFALSCGRCYEVRCDPRAALLDGYGNEFDRSTVCKAGTASVVVRTVDSCPCVYPGNSYSNKRWCCGDNTDTQGTHFDLSIWAFEKLAQLEQGVAGIEFRPVPCSHIPDNRAPEPPQPTPMPDFEQPSALGFPGDANSPGGTDILQQQLVVRFDDSGKEQGAVRPMESFDKGGDVQVVTRGELLNQRGGSGGSGSGGGASPPSPSQPPSSSQATSALYSALHSAGNGCDDKVPSGSSCQQQKKNGQCDQPWLLGGNYCRATCGRCKLGGAGTPAPPASASASTSSSASGPSSGSGSGSEAGSSCSDVVPPGQRGCAKQKEWGNCSQGWLSAGGYCARTCGRCS